MANITTNTGDFFAVANKERLILSQGGRFLELCRPFLISSELSTGMSPIDLGMNRQGLWDFVAGVPSIRCKLTFGCSQFEPNRSLPSDLRFADDMTVRELLAAINRKVIGREA